MKNYIVINGKKAELTKEQLEKLGIDIETNDGGYVKFDFDGKRYIYYNCFVETIAEAK